MKSFLGTALTFTGGQAATCLFVSGVYAVSWAVSALVILIHGGQP